MPFAIKLILTLFILVHGLFYFNGWFFPPTGLYWWIWTGLALFAIRRFSLSSRFLHRTGLVLVAAGLFFRLFHPGVGDALVGLGFINFFFLHD